MNEIKCMPGTRDLTPWNRLIMDLLQIEGVRVQWYFVKEGNLDTIYYTPEEGEQNE